MGNNSLVKALTGGLAPALAVALLATTAWLVTAAGAGQPAGVVGAREVAAAAPASALPMTLPGCQPELVAIAAGDRPPGLSVLAFVDVTTDADIAEGVYLQGQSERWGMRDPRSLRQQTLHQIADFLLADQYLRQTLPGRLAVHAYANETVRVEGLTTGAGLGVEITSDSIETIHEAIANYSYATLTNRGVVNFDYLFGQVEARVSNLRDGPALVLLLNEMTPNGSNDSEGDYAETAYDKWSQVTMEPDEGSGQGQATHIYMLDISAAIQGDPLLAQRQQSVREKWQSGFFDQEGVSGALRSINHVERLHSIKRIIEEVTGQALYQSLPNQNRPVSTCPFAQQAVVALLFNTADDKDDYDSDYDYLPKVAEGSHAILFEGADPERELLMPINPEDREVLYAQRVFGGVLDLRCPARYVTEGDYLTFELTLSGDHIGRALTPSWSPTGGPADNLDVAQGPRYVAPNSHYRWMSGPARPVLEETTYSLALPDTASAACLVTVVPRPELIIESATPLLDDGQPITATVVLSSVGRIDALPIVVLESATDPAESIPLRLDATSLNGSRTVYGFSSEALAAAQSAGSWMLKATLDGPTVHGLTVHLHDERPYYAVPRVTPIPTPEVRIKVDLTTSMGVQTSNDATRVQGDLPYSFSGAITHLEVSSNLPISYTAIEMRQSPDLTQAIGLGVIWGIVWLLLLSFAIAPHLKKYYELGKIHRKPGSESREEKKTRQTTLQKKRVSPMVKIFWVILLALSLGVLTLGESWLPATQLADRGKGLTLLVIDGYIIGAILLLLVMRSRWKRLEPIVALITLFLYPLFVLIILYLFPGQPILQLMFDILDFVTLQVTLWVTLALLTVWHLLLVSWPFWPNGPGGGGGRAAPAQPGDGGGPPAASASPDQGAGGD